MRDALQCAPKRCTCGRRLGKPEYVGRPYGKWQIECECHLIHQWGFHEKSNGCWRITSPLPLFNSREITVVA